MAFTEVSCPVQSHPGPAWRGGFIVFLRCSVLYNMAFTMAFYHDIYHFMAFMEASSPWEGLERRLHGVPVRCSVLYNMHHEGSSPGLMHEDTVLCSMHHEGEWS